MVGLCVSAWLHLTPAGEHMLLLLILLWCLLCPVVAPCVRAWLQAVAPAAAAATALLVPPPLPAPLPLQYKEPGAWANGHPGSRGPADLSEVLCRTAAAHAARSPGCMLTVSHTQLLQGAAAEVECDHCRPRAAVRQRLRLAPFA